MDHGGPTMQKEDLDIYMAEVGRIPLLSKERELELLILAKTGDAKAKELLITSNLRLVVSIANTYINRGVMLADLIEEGNLGLMKSVDKFEIKHKVKFSTYATFWIKQSISMVIINTSRTVRLPAYLICLIKQWRSAEEVLSHDGTTPSDEDIGKLLGFNKKRTKIARTAIDQQRMFADDPYEIINNKESPKSNITDQYYDDLLEFVDKLPPRESDVIRTRFALDREYQTLQQIGDSLGISRERVRQIENEALDRLREWLVNKAA